MNIQNPNDPVRKVRVRIPLDNPLVSEHSSTHSLIDPLLEPKNNPIFPTGSATISRNPIPDYEPEQVEVLQRKRKCKLGRKKKKQMKKQAVVTTHQGYPGVVPAKPLAQETAATTQMDFTLNGNPILGRGTSINAKPWWESGYWKVGEDEGFREMEVDIGTAGTLAVIGATLRGGKHRWRRRHFGRHSRGQGQP